jgi:hypothetical protein
MNQVIKIMAMNLNENRINKIKERKLKFNKISKEHQENI